MNLKKSDFAAMHKVKRLNIINSISGIKPANLIGTSDKLGNLNVSIFSSVVHLGSNPALLGFILRPSFDVRRDTFENIMETQTYTINHVGASFTEQAHATSAKYPSEISEFEKCGLQPQFIDGFHAPFVKESPVKIAMKFEEIIPIPINDTAMIIGSVEFIEIADRAISNEGYLDFDILDSAGVSGLNTYHSLKQISRFPYARPK